MSEQPSCQTDPITVSLLSLSPFHKQRDWEKSCCQNVKKKSYNFPIELRFLGKYKKIYNKYITDKIRISCNLNLAAHSAPTFTFGELSIDGNAAAMKSFLFAFQTFAKRQLCMDNFFLRTRAEWCPTLWILPDISATAMLTRTIIYSARLREVRKTWDIYFIRSRFWPASGNIMGGILGTILNFAT